MMFPTITQYLVSSSSSLVLELVANCVPLQANSNKGDRLLKARHSCTSDHGTINANVAAILSRAKVLSLTL